MLPPHSPDHQTPNKPLLNFFKTHTPTHPCFYLFILFLFTQTLLLYFTHTPPPNAVVPECPSGKIYVYNLPPLLNKDLLLQNCTDLNPWNWQCGIVTNNGYGKPATELQQILPRTLQTSWYRTNQFSLEVIFHHRILNHRCRTLEPASATAYYIPFYAGLAVGKTLWMNDTAKRDWHCNKMLDWVEKQRYWKRSNGSDHFMAIGRITWDFRRLTDPGQKWGSTFLNMPSMSKVTRLIIEKAPGVHQDVSVPYPTGFHPGTLRHLENWQSFIRSRNRSSLFTFIGATREWVDNDFRGVLMSYCKKEEGSCCLVDCSLAPCASDTSVAMNAFLGSEFCLQPRGDSFTRRSIFDCMLAGAVPVFFWKRTAYDQYEWFLPRESESYSVFIDHEEVRNVSSSVIKDVLMRYGKEEVRRMRERVIQSIPRLIYGGDGSFKDAFDVALDGVMERIVKERKKFE